MKVIFMGTPDFSVGTLEALAEAGHEVVLAVTQPDKPKGRGGKMQYTPVKEAALARDIPVYQPKKIREPECIEELKKYNADIMVVIAFGQILPKEILQMTPYGCINVHASLLPKLRGGAPIHRAIINGEVKTGVTIMQMVKKMDAGCMYAKQEVEIDENINTTQLFEKLQVIGKDLLIETLPSIINQSNQGIMQNEEEVTYAYNIDRSEEKIDFHKTCKEVHNLIRGLSYTPGAYCIYHQKTLKIYQSMLSDLENDNVSVGTLKVDHKDLYVKCADGYLKILSLQPEGKKMMDARSFLNGQKAEDLKQLL